MSKYLIKKSLNLRCSVKYIKKRCGMIVNDSNFHKWPIDTEINNYILIGNDLLSFILTQKMDTNKVKTRLTKTQIRRGRYCYISNNKKTQTIYLRILIDPYRKVKANNYLWKKYIQ